MDTFEAIVVGLGAHGSAAAASLARRGQRVLGLERFGRGEALGSSGGWSRMIRIAHYETPAYVPLARASLDRWQALEAETGIDLLTLTPGLYAGPARSGVVAGSLAAARAGAVGHEILDADAIRARWPVFHPADDTVAVLDTDAGLLRADRAIEAHLVLAERSGAELRFETRAVDWRPAAGGGFEVETADGTVVGAERLVLTAGPWTPWFVPDLRLPLVVERQPVQWFQPAAGPSAVASLGLDRLPIWLWGTESGMFYGFPWDAERGLKIALHHGGTTGDPDAVDRTVGPQDEAVARAFVRRTMPAMDGPVSASTVCLYTNAPDDEFVIDRHPAAPGVAFASACSGHGFKFAPIVGEILADLVIDGRTDWPVDAFRAGRFERPAGDPTG
jgi:sarcosine oxidase